MPSQRELSVAVAFFALLAVAVVAFQRPLGVTGWACLLAGLGFVALGCVGIRKQASATGDNGDMAAAGRIGFAGRRDPDDIAGSERQDTIVGEPSPEERRILDETIAALEAVGGLEDGEVDADSLWTAAQRLDPGQAVGVLETLGSFSAFHELARRRIGRLTFVPVHTEYDRSLLAKITASALSSLGNDVWPDDVAVELPPGGGEGPATIAFRVKGRAESITCYYRWKYPPDDLFAALGRFRTADNPRDLVCADPGDQTLLIAAIRAGTMDELNRRLPAEHDLFGKA